MNRNTAIVFDSCVLYPAPLRDLLIELAGRAFQLQLFRAKWTDQIHEEWINNLLNERPDLSRNKLERTRLLIDENVPECLVTGFEHRIRTLSLPDENDRHVLAAAIESAASMIVTFNLSDFPDEILSSFGVQATHPDRFIFDLLIQYPEDGMLLLEQSIRAIKERLRNPRVPWDGYFAGLRSSGLMLTAARLASLIPDVELSS